MFPVHLICSGWLTGTMRVSSQAFEVTWLKAGDDYRTRRDGPPTQEGRSKRNVEDKRVGADLVRREFLGREGGGAFFRKCGF